MRRLLPILLCWPLLVGAASRSFDGTNDEIDWGDNFDIGPHMMACTWTKLTEDASTDWVTGHSSNLDDIAWSFSQTTSDVMQMRVEENIASGGSINTGTCTTDIDGAWYFVCGSFNDDTSGAGCWVNGTQEGVDATNSLETVTNTDTFKHGEDGDNGNDATGLMAYTQIERAFVVSAVLVTEMMWHPGCCSALGFLTLWGDATEINIQNTAVAGTVAGATTSTDGPPVMIGGYLPL